MGKRTCSIDGCSLENRARGLCTKHYRRLQVHGDPLVTLHTVCETPEEAFRLRTEWQGQCLVWRGSTNGRGYGEMTVGGRKVYAHRYSWAQHNGRWPGRDEEVRHRCDNPPCVNPEHLEIGSHADNMRDMSIRGRAKRATCKNGHPWADPHIAYRTNGARYCRTCKDIARRASDKRRWTCPLCGSNVVSRSRNAHVRRMHPEVGA